LKKRTKKLYESGPSLSGEAEADIFKSFLLLFFKKEGLASACSPSRAHAAGLALVEKLRCYDIVTKSPLR
jgi:hypothetical protein